MRHLVVITATLLTLSACADEAGSRKALRGHGFTNVQLNGVSFMGCGENEGGTHFTAKAPDGKLVDGIVCCGLLSLKGCTVRF